LTFTKGFQRTTLDIPVREGKMDELPSPLSSRPERTRISCYAVLANVHVCGFPLKKAA
jgi:hypothetical protein